MEDTKATDFPFLNVNTRESSTG